MNDLFHLEWREAEGLKAHLDTESAATLADLRISSGRSAIDGICLSRNERRTEDGRIEVQDDVFVSVYPLATWFAWNYYRLSYESTPSENVHWDCAHNIANVGDGYVWPPIRIYSDGARIVLRPWTAEVESRDPIRYTANVPLILPLQDFQKQVWDFLRQVDARLAGKELHDTEYQRIYRELLDEQKDGETLLWRSIEARMGFSPDEATEKSRGIFLQICSLVDKDSQQEIAGGGQDAWYFLDHLRNHLHDFGVVRCPRDAYRPEHITIDNNQPAWVLAVRQAQALRSVIGKPNGRLSNEDLAQIYGISVRSISGLEASKKEPITLFHPETEKVLIGKNHETGRRFAVARLIADDMLRTPETGWGVVTDSRTYRQKFQRAFAAELLFPRAELAQRITDPDDLYDLAEAFGVSEMVVRHTLENHLTNTLSDPLDRWDEWEGTPANQSP
ncbi:ImmA/IrrE family metallo-endopeptidase [Acidihalobacter prosperus]|uniref:IrrE N-terminal-like domain-containing protein n=1 Tax=Acidihalobacter prosperus TaxID=160660 RepID=A0A1A6BZZ7_9GAMM|nr:ImmA/IrrE family metallo-endopeptidase [Acidihalobacter prosperus]OBS07882.1 hypothetical protein Thpro_022132 [Acidihalobacter prosperus]